MKKRRSLKEGDLHDSYQRGSFENAWTTSEDKTARPVKTGKWKEGKTRLVGLEGNQAGR